MMYIPSDDSLLLADAVKGLRGDLALEIGAGSCLVTLALQAKYKRVIACDIYFSALQYCKQLDSGSNLVCCDGASGFSCKFDLIVSNPPYLPGEPDEDRAIFGGPSGIEKTIEFAKSALPLLDSGGKMLLVVSSKSDLPSLNRWFSEQNLCVRKVSEKKLFFEIISVIEVT